MATMDEDSWDSFIEIILAFAENTGLQVNKFGNKFIDFIAILLSWIGRLLEEISSRVVFNKIFLHFQIQTFFNL